MADTPSKSWLQTLRRILPARRWLRRKTVRVSRWIPRRPESDDLKASVEGEQIHVVFHAADGFSNIKRAEYSVDAGDWQYVEPVGQLADSKTASYDFQTAIPAAANSSRSDAGEDIGRACGRGQSLRPLRQHEFREDGDWRQVTPGDSRLGCPAERSSAIRIPRNSRRALLDWTAESGCPHVDSVPN